MSRLLSDNEGKIAHVVVSSPTIEDIPRVQSLVDTFDPDVRITIIYPGTPEDTVPTRFGTFGKRLIHRELSHLEHLVAELHRRISIDYLPVPNEPWPWLNDLMHVGEDRVVIPANFFTYDSQLTERVRQSIADIVSSPYWGKNNFNIQPNTTDLFNTHNADLIVFNETVFVGSNNIIGAHISHTMNISPHEKFPQRIYDRARTYVLRRLSMLDSERKFQLMDVSGKILNHYLDILFTPIDDDTVVVADMNTALKYMDIPPEIQPIPLHQPLISQLDDFAKRLERKYKRVLRLPLIPSLYSPKGSIESGITSNNTNGDNILYNFISYNNILQEKYEVGGITIHRVYIPVHSIKEIDGIPGVDPEKFMQLQTQAISTYESLGIQVRPIYLQHTPDAEGMLRFSTKVLERKQ